MKKRFVFACLMLTVLLLGNTSAVAADSSDEKIDLGKQAIGETVPMNVISKSAGSTYENQTVYATYEILTGSESIERIDYWETGVGTPDWYELTGGRFGPTGGFPYIDNLTSQFRFILSNTPGTVTGKIEIRLKATDAVIYTYDIKMDVVGPTVTIGGVESSYVLGDTIEFTVSTDAPAEFLALSKIVKGTGTIGFDPESADMEYFDETENKWLPFEGDTYGPVAGFPFMKFTSKFRLTPKEVGTYAGNIDIIDATTSEVLATTVFSFDVVKAEEEIIDNKDKEKETGKEAEKETIVADNSKKVGKVIETADTTNILGFGGLFLVASVVLLNQLKKQRS